MKIAETKDGVIIEVFVKPNSAKFEVKINSEEIVVYSTEEPERGKVNKELLKEFTKLFRHRVKIISGSTSRSKKILVEGTGKSEVEQILQEV